MKIRYNDKIQANLEAVAMDAVALKKSANGNWDSEIGIAMLKFNLFYDEAVERWRQALKTIKQ